MPQLKDPSPWRRATRATLALIGLALAGCTTAGPQGAPFVPATKPSPSEALVYVYRTEPLRGIPAVGLKLDTQNLGELHKGEYLSLLVKPGRHVLAARMKWLGIIPRSWNSVAFTAQAGQTVYLRVKSGYQADAGSPAGLRESTGGEPTGGVAIFLTEQSADLATLELPAMRRGTGR
jgi:hypothetical protein